MIYLRSSFFKINKKAELSATIKIRENYERI